MTESIQKLIDDCNSELNEIEEIINRLSPFDRTQQFLTKYALIKASGTLETAYHHIVAEYLEQFNIPQVNYFIAKNVRVNSSSVRYDNMTNLLGSFDKTWKSTFKKNVSARAEKDRLLESAESLVNNRHAFAHGANTTVSFKDVKTYYLDTLELIKEFDNSVK